MTSNERVRSIFKAPLTKEAPRLAFYLAAPVPVVISLHVLLRARLDWIPSRLYHRDERQE